MKQSWEKIGTAIGLIIANVFVVSAIAAAAYNSIIAWEFNLPQLDYWAVVLIRIAYLMWFGKARPSSKGEK